MDIKNKTVLVLGGWGLVGSAVVRRLVKDKPSRIVVTSRYKHEAQEAVALFREEFPGITFESWWGNLFVQYRYKDLERSELLHDDVVRRQIMHDVLDDLTDEALRHTAIYKLFTSVKPNIIIDCVNTATGIAYQDVFAASREVMNEVEATGTASALRVETLLTSLYIPQLIRHVQVLHASLRASKVGLYLKIGTSGTGGMGLNIPYTHSEERPSRVLLGKSSVAGAHTLLLFLMGRTPGGPVVKEIKPTATIGWKRVGYGEIKKHGKAIPIVDCRTPVSLASKLRLTEEDIEQDTGRTLQGVFIDTGENGIFSRGEFETVSSLGQMEMVTPEEIAENVAREICGTATGKDVVAALDGAVMDPTYRAGVMRSIALQMLEKLEKEHDAESIAFEMLGPPRLSKLLYEAHLLQRVVDSMRELVTTDAADLASSLRDLVKEEHDLRTAIISIGIPILLPDGKSLIRANHIKIPPYRGQNVLSVSPALIDDWASQGWVDLRAKNVLVWQKRIRHIMEEARRDAATSGSGALRTPQYWNNFETVPVAKLVSWIFAVEDQGERMKG